MSAAARALRERFAPVLERVRTAGLHHEVHGGRPFAEVSLLADAGFGALRVPVAEGGGGVGLAEFIALLVDVAAADPNQAQIWRNHIAFVEDRLLAGPEEQNRHWRAVLAGGAVVGGAWTEPSPTPFGKPVTRVVPGEGGEGWRLTGTKYYSTGSIYADWISVTARRATGPDEAGEEGHEDVIAVVDARAPGVVLTDDWGGIGQRTTGSGTSAFTDVPVTAHALIGFHDRAPHQEAVYQLVLLAALAGIARAAQRDVVATLQERRRAYPQGNGDVPRADPQLQAVVGRVSALASSAEASVLRAAERLDLAAAASTGAAGGGGAGGGGAGGGGAGDRAAAEQLLHEGAVAVYEAQVTVTDDVLTATTLIYDALGSSAVETGTRLDRHWRNARTVTSHNPRVYKERIVGAWYLNATAPAAFGAP